MIIRADLHLHSCLSPCGDLTMSPRKIAQTLASRNVQLAALTDHNTALNCPAFAAACSEFGIIPLFGIEAQGIEECHILCLFADLQAALDLGTELYERMPMIPNNPVKMGDQVYVDENEDIIGEVDKYLITSADIGIEELGRRVIAAGGILIPAHVDRPAFSLTSQLGSVVDGPWSALEMIRMPDRQNQSDCIDTRNYPLITSSDAHNPEHIGRRAFALDIGDAALVLPNGNADIQTIKSALEKRPR